jgi:hypothetical protein
MKKERRSQGETWVLYFRTTRNRDGRRVESKVPIGLVKNFPEKSHAWDAIPLSSLENGGPGRS